MAFWPTECPGTHPLVQANTVYSNGVGISINNGWSNYLAGVVVANNLVYANTAEGIEATGDGTQLTNNAVYQIVGDAVQVRGSSQNVTVLNNILWTQAGYDLDVAGNSQQGLTSDYNLFYLGTNLTNAHLGFWNGNSVNPAGSGTPEQEMAPWTAASGQDADSLFANPDFVDPNGADGILGYTPAAGGYDGGKDDNFYLLANSPAIGNGTNTDAPPTDITGDRASREISTSAPTRSSAPFSTPRRRPSPAPRPAWWTLRVRPPRLSTSSNSPSANRSTPSTPTPPRHSNCSARGPPARRATPWCRSTRRAAPR